MSDMRQQGAVGEGEEYTFAYYLHGMRVYDCGIEEASASSFFKKVGGGGITPVGKYLVG